MHTLRQIDVALSRQCLSGVMVYVLVAIVAAASPNLGRDGHAMNSRMADFDARQVLPEVRVQSQATRRVDHEKPDPEAAGRSGVSRSRFVGDVYAVAAQCQIGLDLGALVRAGFVSLPPPRVAA